ncbi:uncharacterized protein B0P05DRAFT_536928 [Gilbertella persicaria]|uniref:uncharacterized protein n=1 Tax=Gilbertella persicaria TaxID=101096 RepID=UPI0022206EAC|nr:uncharacterized protein B0P05DRAFT_536928 [Gilbertella persicaria]KAI8083328.1 hypothetical protein B0P05DRAFT_536928 [Gilbertella persicaria]
MSKDPWDDWETATEAGLNDIPKSKTLSNQQLWEKANAYSTPMIVHTNQKHTEYKPELKILKRSADIKPDLDPAKKTVQVKALAQRQKDYEEAKRRIEEKFNKKS